MTPADWTVVVGIPLERGSFFASRSREFAGLAVTVQSWPVYEREVVRPLRAWLIKHEEYGGKVIENAGVGALAGAMRSPVRVVTLVSHWFDEHVEFADGARTGGDIVSALPQPCGALLDLCICHPTPLVRELFSKRRDVRQKSTAIAAQPLFWAGLYRVALESVRMDGLEFVEAIDTALRLLLRRGDE